MKRVTDIFDEETGEFVVEDDNQKDYYEHKRQNHEGYSDETHFEAEDRIEYERQKRRVAKVIQHIMYICNLAGYHVDSRIVLRDRKTGKVWR